MNGGLGPANDSYNQRLNPPMVRDGIFYGLALLLAAAAVAYFANPWFASAPALLALFFFWFFRDPQRTIPVEEGAVVSPADGKITSIANFETVEGPRTRISIFLSVFDVHVNRAPVSGVVRNIEYKTGRFCNAMDPACVDQNEQNVVTIEGDGYRVVMKQIAGLLARRIVFHKKLGDSITRGERVGLIKFGSRTDLVLPAEVQLTVKNGDRVKGGASLIGRLPVADKHLSLAGAGQTSTQKSSLGGLP